MKRRRAVMMLGVVALFASTFMIAGVDTSIASTNTEEEGGLVIPPGGGEIPPPEVQDLVNPPPPEPPTGSTMHPTYALLDKDATNVLSSGNPVSTMNTCGQCHDSAFIVEHNYHASVGLDALTEPGTAASGRAWDISNGWFGRWNPITYRYLTPEGDELLDLSTAEWIMTLGQRHAGGGPAHAKAHHSPASIPTPPTPRQVCSQPMAPRWPGTGTTPVSRNSTASSATSPPPTTTPGSPNSKPDVSSGPTQRPSRVRASWNEPTMAGIGTPTPSRRSVRSITRTCRSGDPPTSRAANVTEPCT